MRYLDLEDAIFELKSVRKLLEIVLENVFDEQSKEISSWATRYDSVIAAEMRSLDNGNKTHREIFNMLHEEKQKLKKENSEDSKNE